MATNGVRVRVRVRIRVKSGVKLRVDAAARVTIG